MDDEAKKNLGSLLQARPSQDQVKEKGIMLEAGAFEASKSKLGNWLPGRPSMSEMQSRGIVFSGDDEKSEVTRKTLEDFLGKRPTAEFLKEQGIMRAGDDEKYEVTRKTLEDFLAKRPTAESLKEQGIDIEKPIEYDGPDLDAMPKPEPRAIDCSSENYEEHQKTLENFIGRRPTVSEMEAKGLLREPGAFMASASKIDSFLGHRPTPDSLKEQGIIRDGDEEKFDETRKTLESFLGRRPTATDLKEQNIMRDEKEGEEKMEETQKTLESLLGSRPTATEVVEKGIIPKNVIDAGQAAWQSKHAMRRRRASKKRAESFPLRLATRATPKSRDPVTIVEEAMAPKLNVAVASADTKASGQGGRPHQEVAQSPAGRVALGPFTSGLSSISEKQSKLNEQMQKLQVHHQKFQHMRKSYKKLQESETKARHNQTRSTNPAHAPKTESRRVAKGVGKHLNQPKQERGGGGGAFSNAGH